MKKICLMMTVTTDVAAALLSQIRATDALRPGPGLRERLHSSIGIVFRRLRRMLDNWVAQEIAHRERQATLSVPRYLSGTELRDFGVYRGRPGSTFHRHRDVKSATLRGRRQR